MENRKNNYLIHILISISLVSFVYLNFIGVGDTSDFAFSSISAYENVSSSSFKELKAVTAFLSKVFEIITLN